MTDKFFVWMLGIEVIGLDKSEWRRDELGNLIRYSDYGNRLSPYGWEIDHRVPKALGGSDHISNLRPLYHAANSKMGGILGSLLGRI